MLTDWDLLGALEVPSGVLLVGDYSYLPDPQECVVAEVPTGTLLVLVRTIAFGGDERVAGVRVVTSADGSHARSGLIGTAGTDTGKTGICDRARYSEEFDRLDVRNRWSEFMGEVDRDPGPGSVHLGGAETPSMYFVPAGFGDGTYPVYRLVVHGQAIGLEVEFIRPDQPYPF